MPRSVPPESHSASPPAQKPRPAPVRRMVRTSSRKRSSRKRVTSSVAIGQLTAFRRSGRLKVTMPTPESTLNSTGCSAMVVSSGGLLLMEASHDVADLVLVAGERARQVEEYGREDALAAGAHLGREPVVGRDDGPLTQHVVGD